VSDASLIMGAAHQVIGMIRKEETHRPGSHRAAVPSGMFRRSGFLPGNPAGETLGGFLGCQSSTDDAILDEQGSDAARVVRWLKTAALDEAQNQFARKLGVIGVLAERKASTLHSLNSAWLDDLVDIVLARGAAMAFNRETQSVSQTLADEATCILAGGRPRHSGARFVRQG
jgi:hypothetical protein